MTERELCQKFDIHIHIFDGDELEDSDEAFYIADLRTVFVSSHIAPKDRVQYILHELGHINHNPANYQRLLMKYENEADRFMIRHLIEEELSQYDVIDFNWLQFAKRHKISTTWGEQMIQEEFRNIVGM